MEQNVHGVDLNEKNIIISGASIECRSRPATNFVQNRPSFSSSWVQLGIPIIAILSAEVGINWLYCSMHPTTKDFSGRVNFTHSSYRCLAHTGVSLTVQEIYDVNISISIINLKVEVSGIVPVLIRKNCLSSRTRILYVLHMVPAQ